MRRETDIAVYEPGMITCISGEFFSGGVAGFPEKGRVCGISGVLTGADKVIFRSVPPTGKHSAAAMIANGMRRTDIRLKSFIISVFLIILYIKIVPQGEFVKRVKAVISGVLRCAGWMREYHRCFCGWSGRNIPVKQSRSVAGSGKWADRSGTADANLPDSAGN